MDQHSLDTAFPCQSGVIDRIEGEQVIIRLPDGQEINWPKKQLLEFKEGAAVKLVIQTEGEAEQERQKLAKTILNEILKPSNSSQ
jgi:hypothetical protein